MLELPNLMARVAPVAFGAFQSFGGLILMKRDLAVLQSSICLIISGDSIVQPFEVLNEKNLA